MNSLQFLAVARSISVFLIFLRCPYGGANGWITGLLAIGVFYCLEAGWSQLRPLDILGSHLPLSLMHLLTKNDVAFLLHLYPLLSFTFI